VPRVETGTPADAPEPIGPYNHIAEVGSLINIGGTAGVDPATGPLAGTDVGSQTRQILYSFQVMLESVGSDLAHVVHVNIFLSEMNDFEAMNVAYVEKMGDHRPARTVIGVRELAQARRAADHESHCPDYGLTYSRGKVVLDAVRRDRGS
jgi:2-iminobutanoate/2-iminopropanoate deaminase